LTLLVLLLDALAHLFRGVFPFCIIWSLYPAIFGQATPSAFGRVRLALTVYDQDHLILVSENGGDLVLTKEFADYQKTRKFKIYMCRKADPETKGKVENVVKYVKRNFAKNRTFHNLEKLNEDCLAWLERTGNGKVHNTTKKIPAEVFVYEKQHLIPVPHKINISTTKIITRVIRKDNTIVYQGNRYALPLGTYAPDRRVVVKEEEGILIIADPEDELEIIRYPVCLEKGRLIKSSDCRREKDKGIKDYLQEVAVQTIFIWTHGKSIIRETRDYDLKGLLLNPNILATILGIILFVNKVSLPSVLGNAVSATGSMVGPISMIITGIIIASMDLVKVFNNIRAYIVSAARLVFYPLMVVFMCCFSGMLNWHPQAEKILLIVLLASAAPTASAITQMAQIYNKDAYNASVINVMSIIFCIITMPVIVFIYQAFC
jgi:hypothetical protein